MIGNSDGGVDEDADGGEVIAEEASGIADGDTLTGFPQLAPGASWGVWSVSDSVIGGVFGQSTE